MNVTLLWFGAQINGHFFVAVAGPSRDHVFMQDVARGPMDGTKKILVVDDTESVSELMREMLRTFGYDAEICETVDAALAAFAPGKFDLVITDYLMPKMNGVDLARALKQQSPVQRILLITGSTFPMTESATRQLPVEATLQKPFSVDEFRQAIVDVLTAQPVLLTAAPIQSPHPPIRAR
jgi:CheY-like chemotaxis protein